MTARYLPIFGYSPTFFISYYKVSKNIKPETNTREQNAQ